MHVEGMLLWYFQVYVYNEDVVTNSIRPSLVDLFVEVARKIDDKVIGTECCGVTDWRTVSDRYCNF